MAQMDAVRGTRTQRRRLLQQRASLSARQAAFPSILAAEQAESHRKEDKAFREKEFGLEKRKAADARKSAKKNLAFQREESRKGMGLEALKLGGTVASMDFSKLPLVGGMFGGGAKPGVAPGITSNVVGRGNVGGPFAAKTGMNRSITGANVAPSTGDGGFFSGLNMGGALQGGIAGGMAGYGLASMFGGGSKKKRFLGAGGGMLVGGLLGSGALSGAGQFLGSMFGGKA